MEEGGTTTSLLVLAYHLIPINPSASAALEHVK